MRAEVLVSTGLVWQCVSCLLSIVTQHKAGGMGGTIQTILCPYALWLALHVFGQLSTRISSTFTRTLFSGSYSLLAPCLANRIVVRLFDGCLMHSLLTHCLHENQRPSTEPLCLYRRALQPLSCCGKCSAHCGSEKFQATHRTPATVATSGPRHVQVRGQAVPGHKQEPAQYAWPLVFLSPPISKCLHRCARTP